MRPLQCGDASGTGLFDTANRTYDTKRMETIDKSLPDFFPELIGPNEVGFCTPPPILNVALSSWSVSGHPLLRERLDVKL